jgi:hypothetical protein
MRRSLATVDPLDIPFQAFQKRLRDGELATPDLNDQNRRLFGIPSQTVVREAFIADREGFADSYQGESLKFVPMDAAAFGKRK